MIKTLTALTLALLSTSAAAETLVTNINGIQVGTDGSLQHFTGLLIDDNGKVRSVLTGPPPPMTFEHTVDGQGRTLLPGLIDAHGHVMGLGQSASMLDLTGTRSLEELQQRLRDYAAARPNDRWLLGRGWNQELWAVKSFPTAADLDAIVPGRPVVLERVDGHALVANSAAMSAAGVTAQTKAPSGGEIHDGLFVDAAMGLIGSKVPAATAAQQDAWLAKAQAILLGFGVTATADMGTDPQGWAAMRRAGDAGTLNVRIMSYGSGLNDTKRISARPTAWLYSDRLKLEGVKLYDDGALGSRGAWLKAPYADKPDSTGLRFHSDAEYQALVSDAASHGYQVATHAIGDAANAQVIDTYVKLGAASGNKRWRIEHAQIVDPVDLPKIGANKIIASMQPTHQISDRLMAEKRLGPLRLTGAYAWQSILRSGTQLALGSDFPYNSSPLLAFGSDYPVESPNPFPGLLAAVSRQDMNGEPPGGWLPSERLTFPQALHAFTRGAAYAGFAEGKIGSLEPGKWADFIIVDRDVAAADPQVLARTQVLETWVAGKKVWERSASAGGERGR